ncbi:MAG TPA: hypothetical protein VG370_26635 [Chloroflexota bacterium]|jgi:hypothetical protein|nr:hypothetical protein [Chloroflexota bacterium]
MTGKRKPARGAAAAADAESRALAASPAFQALLAAGRASPAVPLEELDRRLGPLTEADKARAAAHLRVLERVRDEQGGQPTDEQDRLIELVLTAADHARGRGVLAQLAADSGFTEAEIRAVAAALEAVGLRESAAVS